jgi:acetolactate decarboxylase
MKVEETYDLRAPFFAYARIEKWQEMILSDSIRTMKNLENHLLHQSPDCPGPFMFKLTGIVETATIHIVNLSPGSKVRSPEDAHRG